MQDEDIIQSILQGNGQLYGHIVDRYQTKLFRTACHYTQNTEDARDITQEIFIKAYNNLNGFKGSSAFSTWLYRIAINHCLDWIRKNKSLRQEAVCPPHLEHNGLQRTALNKNPRNLRGLELIGSKTG